MSKYIEQWERALRWHERIKVLPDRTIDYDDYLWAFFQNCWHLKDWIKNDASVAQRSRDNIESTVKQYRPLMIAADLANGSKHLTLKYKKGESPRIGDHGARHSHRVLSIVSGDSAASRLQYIIALEGTDTADALDIAQEAIDAWATIISCLEPATTDPLTP